MPAAADEKEKKEELTDGVETLKKEGTLPSVWNTHAPSKVRGLVSRMVEHKPQKRPSAAECLELWRVARTQAWSVVESGAGGEEMYSARAGGGGFSFCGMRFPWSRRAKRVAPDSRVVL